MDANREAMRPSSLNSPVLIAIRPIPVTPVVMPLVFEAHAIRAVAYLKRGNWPNDELNAENKPFSGVETGMERRTKGRPTADRSGLLECGSGPTIPDQSSAARKRSTNASAVSDAPRTTSPTYLHSYNGAASDTALAFLVLIRRTNR